MQEINGRDVINVLKTDVTWKQNMNKRIESLKDDKHEDDYNIYFHYIQFLQSNIFIVYI